MRKTFVVISAVIWSLIALLGHSAAQAQGNPTSPQTMPITFAAPKPAKQTGLRRPQGDGNVWTFQIEPEPGIIWVEGPNWHYPGEGSGADPDWGQWGGGDGGLWLSWVSPKIASSFSIRVTGKISRNGTGNGEPIDIEAGWEGEVTTFTIAVRRKGSSDEFSGSATVAAGNISNEGHQADVEITGKDAAGNPVAGVTVPAVSVLSGGLGGDSSVTASVSMTTTTTDANGKALGTFTSGNRTQDTVIILDTDADAGTTTGEPTATITQKWNENDEPWTYEEYFEYDVPSTLTYAMEYGSATVIVGHSMDFETLEIGGLEWDPDEGEDWDEDGFPDGDYIETSYSIDDVYTEPFDYWSPLVTYSSVDEDPAGSYNTDQTIAFDWDFIADYVGFQIIDTHTYDETGA